MFLEKDFPKQQIIVEKLLGPNLELIRNNNCYIAGGTLTSTFTNTYISDIDIYFRDKATALAVQDLLKPQDITHQSTNAITLKHNKTTLQYIVNPKFIMEPEDMLKEFDFTVCQAALRFDADQAFLIHEKFFEHLASRSLIYNPKAKYPILTLKRMLKYIGRGYTIDNLNLLSIALGVNNLTINSWKKVLDQLESMSGDSYNLIASEIKKNIENGKQFDFIELVKLLEIK